MKSPITGKEMELQRKNIALAFRKENFQIVYHNYLCKESGEEFTSDELDVINHNQIHNKYREKYGIPFPEEIINIRKRYSISAAKMSEILGLGANTYRLYESGEMPSVANGRLILSISDPSEFIKQVEASSHILSEQETQKLLKKAKTIQKEKEERFWDSIFEQQIFPQHSPSEFNGYREPSLTKIAQVIAYFYNEGHDLFKTKMNKLLFYSDFLMYQRNGYSITGIAYKAIPFGPVPSQYDKMYIKLCDDHEIITEQIPIGNGNYGELVKFTGSNDFQFSIRELEVLNIINQKFKGVNTKEIVEASHLENAWIDNEQSKSLISYQKYAYDIKVV